MGSSAVSAVTSEPAPSQCTLLQSDIAGDIASRKALTPLRSYSRGCCDLSDERPASPRQPGATEHASLTLCACDIGEACPRDPLSGASLPQLPRAARPGVVFDLLPDFADVPPAGRFRP